MQVEFRPGACLNEAQKAQRVATVVQEIQQKLYIRMEVSEAPYLSLPRFEFKTRRWTDQRRRGRSFIKYTT